MQGCYCFPQISFTRQDDRIQPVLADVHLLRLDDHPEPGEKDLRCKGFKPELCTTGGEWFNYSAHVVTDQTELCASSFLLHGSSKTGKHIF